MNAIPTSTSQAATEWPKVPFGEVADSISQTHPMDKERLVFLNTSDVYKGRILHNDYSLVKDWPGQAKKSIRCNDILFSEIRPANGRYAFVDVDADDYVVSTKLMVIRARDPGLARFLYHFLTSDATTSWLQHLAESRSGTFPQITFDQVAQLQVPLPPSPEVRQAIVAIIDSLDHKIEQNRRTTQAVERLARAIFRAWFVDFEPAKAKAAGATAFPSMPQNTFDALPIRFVDSELGPIPEDWEAGALSDIASPRRDGVQPGDIDSMTPYIGLEHMPRRCIALYDWEHAGKVTSGKARFSAGEILFGKLRPYFHKVGVAPIDGVCSTDIVVITPKTPAWFGLALGHVSSDEFVAYTSACSTGTKMPRTNWGDMARYAIAIPPESVATAFANIVAPMIGAIVNGIFESRKLAAMRELLLPPLLSGQVRVETRHD